MACLVYDIGKTVSSAGEEAGLLTYTIQRWILDELKTSLKSWKYRVKENEEYLCEVYPTVKAQVINEKLMI